VIAACLSALPWLFRQYRERIMLVLPSALAVLAVAAAGMLYYNTRITGSPLRMPYTTIHQAYSVAPLFVWQERTPDPEYRHASLRRFYLEAEPHYQNADRVSTFQGWLSLQPSRLRMAKDLLFGNFFLFLALPVLLWPGSDGMRAARAALALFFVALALESWNQIHYFGPVIGLAMLVKLAGLNRLSAWRLAGRPIGMALALAVALCASVRLAQGALEFSTPDAFALQRAQLLRQLEGQPGEQVVLVRYSDAQPTSEEWVYNHADIDASKVVWARDMGPEENRKLFDYFRGRSFWLLEPAPDNPRLTALPSTQRSARDPLSTEKTP
jgi:hypothetical protein